MKVDELLDVVIATRFRIVCDNKDYIVDYAGCDGYEPLDYGAFIKYPTKVCLPDDLLSRDVEFIDGSGNDLYIRVK